MVAKKILLGTAACLALAACSDSDDVLLTSAAIDGPLGLTFDTPVNVMSSDREEGNTVRVSEQLATITLNDLVFEEDGDIDSFSVTLGLPDGTSVTLTEANVRDDHLSNINGHRVLRADLNTDLDNEGEPTEDGDEVHVLIGLGLGTPDPNTDEQATEDALFMLARVDLVEPEPGEGEDPIADQGFNVYMVTGEETAELPSGWATYSGKTIATVYQNGDLVSDRFFGDADISAFFATSSVNIELDGNYSGNGQNYYYHLEGENIPIVGSRYRGALGLAGFEADDMNESHFHGPGGSVDIAGDVIGAFFGAHAEATAGVFSATETGQEEVFNDEDVEIVGGFAAYSDTPPCSEC